MTRSWQPLAFFLLVVLTAPIHSQSSSSSSQLPELQADNNSIEELTVTTKGHWQRVSSITTVQQGYSQLTQPTHANQVLAQVPSLWISRGDGQEHLTALRSAVLTGAGSCGSVVYMEQGIPIRPSSFCNVNNLFEVDVAGGDEISVYKGPGSAVLGANAISGAINTQRRLRKANDRISIFSSETTQTVRLDYFNEKSRVNLLLTDSDSFRDDSGYTDVKFFTLFEYLDWDVSIAHTSLDQETAGYISSYKDEDIRVGNANPEAYRKASSTRFTMSSTRDGYDFDAWLRVSDMEFIQHYLPSNPIEENGHNSAGSRISTIIPFQAWQMRVGGMIETSSIQLKQSQSHENECRFGTCYAQGTHYDYQVAATSLALFTQSFLPLENWNLIADARIERTSFQHTTELEQGSTCADWQAEVNSTFSGTCRYYRPGQRDDEFVHLGWRLGANRPIASRFSDASSKVFFSVSQGYRPPQVAEIYRLEYDVDVADLVGENSLQLEAGVNYHYHDLQIDASVWLSDRKNVVYRDADKVLNDNGETSHHGIELSIRLPEFNRKSFELNVSYGRHTYESDIIVKVDQNGNNTATNIAGNVIDTAPEWQVSGKWQYSIAAAGSLGFEIVALDKYYPEPGNSKTYPGHLLFHTYYQHKINPRSSFNIQIRNLNDKLYAERADFAFGNHRYFPGAPRTVGVEYSYLF